MKFLSYIILSFLLLHNYSCSLPDRDSKDNCDQINGEYETNYDCGSESFSLLLFITQDGCSLAATAEVYTDDSFSNKLGSYLLDGEFINNSFFDLKVTEWIDFSTEFERQDIMGLILEDKDFLQYETTCGHVSFLIKR